MSEQYLFNFIALHLLRQNKKSCDEKKGTCAYRGDGGRKCAVGAIIPDAMMTPNLEGKRIRGIIVTAMRQRGILMNDSHERSADVRLTQEQADFFTSLALYATLLDDLQDIHDGAFPCEWPDRISDVAKKWSLNVSDELGNMIYSRRTVKEGGA